MIPKIRFFNWSNNIFIANRAQAKTPQIEEEAYQTQNSQDETYSFGDDNNKSSCSGVNSPKSSLEENVTQNDNNVKSLPLRKRKNYLF